jgi:DHA3 family macrolide efflux protein-like MFS transporter
MEQIKHKLWTKNFSIITVGTLISMMGNAISNFAISLVILSQTNSTLLFSLYNIITTIPKIFVPMLVGPYVDRTSRKKIVVNIDLIYGFLFAFLTIIVYLDIYSFGFYLMFGITLGVLDSVYQVAYQSFYPEMISEGNFSKAYSISSLIYPIANTIMVPIAGFAYEYVGVTPLFLFNAITFFITQGVERMIDSPETHLLNIDLTEKKSKTEKSEIFKKDFMEGVKYLKGERGLRSITAYFFVSIMLMGVSGTLLLPYFKSSPNLNVSQYSVLMACNTAGRMIGGALHYKFKYPTHLKFRIAVIVYCAVATIDGALLFMGYPAMLVCYVFYGTLSVTSYNIRTSGTQSYVVSDKRGRFNGLFMMITTAGQMLGQLIAGIMGEFLYIPYIIVGFNLINILAVFLIMVPNKKQVSIIYNQQL